MSPQPRPLLVLLVIGMSACGTVETLHRPADAGSKESGADTSTNASSEPCPTSQPLAGTHCSGSMTCEYGSDPSTTCDTVMACSGAAWLTSSTPSDAGCSTTNPATCPSAFSDVTQGEACGSTPFDCYYPEARCSCASVVLQGACRPGDCPAPTWECDTPATLTGDTLVPQKGCPVPRPRIGSACAASDGDTTCNYEPCQGGVALLCTSGAWQLVNDVSCPK